MHAAKLDGLKGYKVIKDKFDLIKLINAIKSITYRFEGKKYHAMALHQVKMSVFTLHQGRNTSDPHYLDKFMTRVSVVEQYGGNIGKDNGAIQTELDLTEFTNTATTTSAQKFEPANATKDKCLSVAFFSAADITRYGKLLEELENYYTKRSNNYP
jgi:hypothetical protein